MPPVYYTLTKYIDNKLSEFPASFQLVSITSISLLPDAARKILRVFNGAIDTGNSSIYVERRYLMRTLKVLLVVVAMLAVSAPSFGYILVYNAFGRLKAVDSETDTLVGIAMRGYLIMDVNENDGDLNDVYWIGYGKDGDGAKVYTVSVPDLQLNVNGKYQTVYMNVDEGWFVTTLGRISNKNIGLADRQPVAYTMSGNLIILDSVVFDMTQLLRGSGSMVISLSSSKSQAANTAHDEIDDVLDNLLTLLETAGYSGS